MTKCRLPKQPSSSWSNWNGVLDMSEKLFTSPGLVMCCYLDMWWMYIAKDFPAKTPKTFNWLGLGFGSVAPKPEALNPEISQQCQAAKHRLHSDVIQHQPIVVPQFISNKGIYCGYKRIM